MDRAGGRVQTRPVPVPPPSVPSIRAARADECGALSAIEVAAGHRFVEVGPADVAAQPPHPPGELEEYRLAGRSWVAVDHDDRPVAFLLAALVDHHAHADEVSVLPSDAGRAIGRTLIDHLAVWASIRGLPGVTLTTFAGVPWNAPYYERCGFHRWDDDDLGPELAAIRAVERSRVRHRWPRVAMYRPT